MERPVQIVPDGPRTTDFLDASCVIATLDKKELVYVEAPERGFIVSDHEIVCRFKRRWDTIRSEALPVGQSIELMLEAARQWSS